MDFKTSYLFRKENPDHCDCGCGEIDESGKCGCFQWQKDEPDLDDQEKKND